MKELARKAKRLLTGIDEDDLDKSLREMLRLAGTASAREIDKEVISKILAQARELQRKLNEPK